MESIKLLRALIFALLVGFGFYFTIIYAAIAETLVIGSSKNAIKIDKITVFDEPWALTFLNQDELLVSTKKGKLWLVQKDGKKSLIDGIPEIAYGGQGGLGDILPHPKFSQNNLLYLSFVASKNNGRTRGAKVIRAKLENGKLINHQLVWEQLPHTRGRGHFSHRLAFGPEGSSHEGMLFISSGDRQIMHPAQTLDNNLGKIIRLHDDGRIPNDNPFKEMGFPANTIWSLGHRNILGISFAPNNKLWANEMGPLHGDELNLISKGENYGWPMVSEGNHYNGKLIPSHSTNDEFTPPVRFWVPTIAPSSLAFMPIEEGKTWSGNAFISGLKSKAIFRLEIRNDQVTHEEKFYIGKRIRALTTSNDSHIWAIEDGGMGRLLKLTLD
ncbi:PQQ-dependent sugar dehydrogenase [Paracoccaceae bacterium]|nr:PQQ-dependent sugar dehydrogenase [Paracoccaceae bacterium]